MPTRELIHISFGSLPAYFSTHHFNFQTGYFDYSSTAPQPLIDHDVSWEEGSDGRGHQRYTPRWMIYDVRSGFDGIRREEVYDDDDDHDDDDDDGEDEENVDAGGREQATTRAQHTVSSSKSTWISKAQVMRLQGGKTSLTPFRRISRKEQRGEDVDWEEELERTMASDDDEEDDYNDEYHGHSGNLEGYDSTTAATSAASPSPDTKGDGKSSRRGRSTPRMSKPWSTKMLFETHPRSLAPVTGAGGLPMETMSSVAHEGVEIFESFEQGWARAKAWERDNDTLDTSFRSLLEASDRPQGFNIVLQSSDAWSGFSAWHLQELADEHPKLERLAWSMRSGAGEGDVTAAEDGTLDEKELRLARIRGMNEALTLLLLTESASLFTPMALPQWPSEEPSPPWAQYLRRDRRARIQTDENYNSALLASQYETATLGMRLRDAPTSASSLVAHLKWRGDTPIASLGGCLPTPLLAPLQSSMTSIPFDPIEALLAARGYNPRPNQDRSRNTASFDPAEIADVGAKAIVKHWSSYSNARQVRMPGRNERKRRLGGNTGPVYKGKEKFVRPYAVQSVARDAQEGARGISEASLREYVTGDGRGKLGMEEPWGRSLFAPLAQPLPPSFPRILRGLTTDGRPYPPTHSTHPPPSRPRPRSLPQISTLSTTPASMPHIKHANWILCRALKSHQPLEALGLTGPATRGTGSAAGGAANEESEGRVGGRDGLKELRERIEELRGAYEVDPERNGAGDGVGEEDEDQGQGTDEDWEATFHHASENVDGEDGLDWE